MPILRTAAILICLLTASVSTFAQTANEPKNNPAEWSKPYQPFRIAGNLYYVGTYDLACYLITTSQGHILINTGLAASDTQIKANVAALGFKFGDIKILTTTQAHYDHMGAMAAIKKQTPAKIMVDEKDAPLLISGGSSDYSFSAGKTTFTPIKPDRLLKDGEQIKLGNMSLTLLHHPGHTKGSCSFIFDVKDEHRTYKVLVANLPTIVTDERFDKITSYPGIAKDYAYTLSAMKKLKFDIWVASHASQFDMHTKHKPNDKYDPAAFVDREGYDAQLEKLQGEFEKRVSGK